MPKIPKKILFAAWACHNKNYFPYQAWHTPLKKLFREFMTFDPQEYIYHHGKEAMNKKFLEIIEKEKPDFIYLWLIYNEFYIDTLLKIKEISPNTRTLNFFGDDDTLFDNYARYLALFIDYPLASRREYIKDYKKDGIKNVFFSCGVNTDNFKYLRLEKKYDVTFIGTPMGDRTELIKYLIDNSIKVRIYGAGWDNYPEFKEYYYGKLSQEEVTQVINQSRINLSLTKNYEGKPSFKARVFEVSACNSFLLSEYFSGYLEFLKEDEEIVMFKDKEELLKKVNYFLKNEKEREEIAEKAYKKTMSNYAQEAEFKKIFKEIEKLEKSQEPKQLPQIETKVAQLSKEDLSLEEEQIKEKIKDAEFISFKEKESIELPHKNYFQIYSLEKTKKEISCCDYFIHSKNLGNYLSFSSNHAFKTLPKEDFFKLLSISQLLMKKDYFLKNINSFKDFNNKKQELINKENTCFISMTLVQVSNIQPIDYKKMEKVFLPEFEDNLRFLRHQKKLWYSSYPYKLVLSSLFKKHSILKPWIKSSFNKSKLQ